MLRELERELESTARAQQAAASERAQQAAEQPATIYTLSSSLSRPVMHLVRMNWAVNCVWHTGDRKRPLNEGQTHTFPRESVTLGTDYAPVSVSGRVDAPEHHATW